jgi:hypothetical protein
MTIMPSLRVTRSCIDHITNSLLSFSMFEYGNTPKSLYGREEALFYWYYLPFFLSISLLPNYEELDSASAYGLKYGAWALPFDGKFPCAINHE